MNPKVSVVIPTYNRAEKVQKGIASVLAQTFTDIEIVVVDDGSSDDTEGILKKVFGSRIRYFYQPNQGVSAARNRGIAEACGEWIAFLDSDDYWDANKLKLQFDALEKFSANCCACYTDTHLFNHPEKRTLFQMAQDSYLHEESTGVNTEVLRLLVKPGGAGMVIHLSSLLASSDVLRRIEGFNTKLRYSEDSDFMFRLAMVTGFCYVNRPLVWFDRAPVEVRHIGVSSEWNRFDCFLQSSQLRLEGLLGMSDRLPVSIRSVIRKQLSEIHSGWANWHLWHGENKKARQAVAKALRYDPTVKLAVKWFLTSTMPGVAARTVSQRQEQKSLTTTV